MGIEFILKNVTILLRRLNNVAGIKRIYKFVTNCNIIEYSIMPGWWNLVDTRDLKSLGAMLRTGSIPVPGTSFISGFPLLPKGWPLFYAHKRGENYQTISNIF